MKNTKESLIPFVIIFVVTLISLQMVSAEKGVGLFWDRTEIQGYVGEKICVNYGLYNPFNTDINAYLDVTRDLSGLQNNDKASLVIQKTQIESSLQKARDNYNANSTIDLAQEIDTLTNQDATIKEKIDKINIDSSILVKAGTSSKEKIIQNLCFYPTKKGIYNGEVTASYLAITQQGTGSSTKAGASAPLRLVALEKENNSSVPMSLWYIGIGVVVFIVIVILFFIFGKKKGLETAMAVLPCLFFLLLFINPVSADLPTPSNVTILASSVTLPYVAFVSPINTTYNSETVTISITNDSNANYIWWNNGTSNLPYISTISLTLTNGNYHFIAYANDSLNNINSTEVSFVMAYNSGGGGGITTISPSRINLYYDQKTVQNKTKKILVEAFDSQNKSFTPQLISLELPSKITLINISYGNVSEINLNVGDVGIGKYDVKITVVGNSILTQDAVIEILSETQIAQLRQDLKDYISKNLNLIWIGFAVMVFITLMIFGALLFDKLSKK